MIRTPLVVAVAVLALAAPAAAQAPTAPQQQIERFVASIKLTDVDRFDHPRQKRTDSGCQGAAYYEGHGRDVQQIQTAPTRVRVMAAGPGTVVLSYGSFTRPGAGLKGTGRLRRTSDEREWTEPGPCTQGPIAPPKSIGDTCTEGPLKVTVSLAIARGKVYPVVQWNELKGGELLLCSSYPTDGGSRVYQRSAQPLRAAQLFDRDREFLVFSGRATIRSHHGAPLAGDRTRELRWTLRLRRAT